MGNQPSKSSPSSRRKSGGVEAGVERVKKVVGEVQEEIKKSVKKLDDDHPAAQFLDQVCGVGYFDDGGSQASSRYHRKKYGKDYYSEDAYSEDGSRTVSEDDTTAYDDQSRRSRADKSVESQSYMSQSDYDSDHRQKRRNHRKNSFDTEEDTRTEASSTVANPTATLQKQPLASSFAKRCYFTKAGIGRTTQHYEGLTLTGNVVLMLASAMKLKGCPTICDEDLRRVEQTYPNQFSRLPDELLLSSGWRRISKYCHFSNKAIPDGVPFFHSKQRLHPSGGYYFLLASAVGMTRPMDVEPLSRDTLVLLETDYPTQCDTAPSVLIKDHEQWTLVNRFCFFSGGPINTEEDVYYQADFDGNPIFMLAFLSPSLTPEELYKLAEVGEPSLKTVHAVEEVESVYDLTERDFDDLKLYHLGPCRALPQYILQPQAWIKILPPHFLAARQQAMIRAEDHMQRNGMPLPPRTQVHEPMMIYPDPQTPVTPGGQHYFDDEDGPMNPGLAANFRREMEEEGAFHDDSHPMDEAHGRVYPNFQNGVEGVVYADPMTPKLDPPDDEPPSLHKGSMELIGQGAVPDPDDPSVLVSPVGASPGGNAFFQGPFHGSPSQQQQRSFPNEQEEEPMSPDDEQQQIGYLISLGSPEEQPNLQFDPFAQKGLDFPQDEFGGMAQNPEEEADPSMHYRPPPGVRALDPLYTERSPTQHDHMEETPHYPDTSADDPNDYGGEEKKMGTDEQLGIMKQHQQHQQRAFMYEMSDEPDLKDGEEDFIPIKREGYRLGEIAAPSPHSVSSENSHQSAAFRSAQELLRKNRRRRMEQQATKQQRADPPELGSEAVATPMGGDDPSAGTWEEGSEISGSNVSGSSLWSDDGSGTAGDRSSRRALILQMAKARMKGNGNSPTKSVGSPNRGMEAPSMIEEEGGSLGGQTDVNTDIDFAGDLD